MTAAVDCTSGAWTDRSTANSRLVRVQTVPAGAKHSLMKLSMKEIIKTAKSTETSARARWRFGGEIASAAMVPIPSLSRVKLLNITQVRAASLPCLSP